MIQENRAVRAPTTIPHLIAHRGNYKGRNEHLENRPDYILEALSADYSVEVDVWGKDGKLYLGHDEPKYPIVLEFLEVLENNKMIFCHMKNLEAYSLLRKSKFVNYFFHDKDSYTLTAFGQIWTCENTPTKNPETIFMDPTNTYIDSVTSAGDMWWMNGLCCDDFTKIIDMVKMNGFLSKSLTFPGSNDGTYPSRGAS